MKEFVYLVRQTQPSADYIKTTLYVYTDKEKAYKVARALNKEYGENCHFTKEYDFIDVKYDVYFDDVHYYDVQAMKLNEELAPFYT